MVKKKKVREKANEHILPFELSNKKPKSLRCLFFSPTPLSKRLNLIDSSQWADLMLVLGRYRPTTPRVSKSHRSIRNNRSLKEMKETMQPWHWRETFQPDLNSVGICAVPIGSRFNQVYSDWMLLRGLASRERKPCFVVISKLHLLSRVLKRHSFNPETDFD